MRDRILVIAGPTAVGKTEYAIRAAEAFNGEIVSCDSMQIYRYMNIGSAKPSPEELSRVPHHLVDFADPREPFTVADYQRLAREAVADIISRGRLPVIAGGTGLYLNSLLLPMDFAKAPENSEYREELLALAEEKGREYLHCMLEDADPEAAARIHPNNVKKVIRALERLKEGEKKVRPFAEAREEDFLYDAVLIGLTRPREELYSRINRRVDMMIDEGLEEEVRGLLDMGLDESFTSMKGIGYKEMLEYLDGRCTLETAIDSIKKNSRHYAKRQLTWFRRYDTMKWYDLSEYLSDSQAVEVIGECLTRRI